MTALNMRFLGGLELRQEGLSTDQQISQKGKALLCYLAVNGKSTRRSTLAGLLWPDKPETHALMNLRKTLHKLKPLSPYLVAERTTVAFNNRASFWLDVAEFETLAARNGDIRRLQKGVALYGGDFLDGFDTADALLFDEWVLAQRSRLRETAVHMLMKLTAHFGALQQYTEAISYARQLLAQEPYHEEVHRELMRFLALSGQRGAALAHYDSLRQILSDELGVEPSPATGQVNDQIRAGQWQAVEKTAVIAAEKQAPPHNVPALPTPLVGRTRELAALDQYMGDPAVRLLTIIGPGGMGKTRLALAAADVQLNSQEGHLRFADGIFAVSLAGVESAGLLPQAIADSIGYQFQGQTERQTQLVRYFQAKKMLLLLDNFEHLLDGVQFLNRMLQEAPGIKLLVTSRERLKLTAEQMLPIGGLAYPPHKETLSLERTKRYSAIQLFIQNAVRLRPAFELTADNQPHVTAICRLVDGMPLGIVLAAAWLDTLTPGEMAQEMARDLSFLESEMADVPRRQRSLRAAFNHSWRLLSQRQREIYCRLALFRGGFNVEAAAAVAEASLRDLQGLVNKSLLVRLTAAGDSAGRFEIHELLRQFAAQALQRRPMLEAAARDAHCRYYCTLVQRQDPHWHTARQLDALREIAREADNVNAAWRRALQTEAWDTIALALDSWSHYLEWRGLLTQGEWQSRTLAERLEKLPQKRREQISLWSKAVAWQGFFTTATGAALEKLQRSLALLDSAELVGQDTRRAEAFALRLLGARSNSVDRKAARRYAEQSRRLYRELDDDWGTAVCLSILAKLDWGTGHYATAQEKTESALATFRKLGDVRMQIESMMQLGWIKQHVGDLDASESQRHEALDLCRKIDDRGNLFWLMADLALMQLIRGRFAECQEKARQCLLLCSDSGQNDLEGYLRLLLGSASLMAGQHSTARRELELSLALVQKADASGIEGTVQCWLGFVVLAEGGDGRGAQPFFREGRRLYEGVEDNYIGHAYAGLAYAACKEQTLKIARRQVVQALKFCVELRDMYFLFQTFPCAALYLALCGETVRALEIWELARRWPFVANSQWHDQVVGQELKARSVDMQPQIIAEAAARGRGLAQWETAELLIAELGQ